MDGKNKMTKEMLAVFNIFSQKFTTPESVSKHLASTVATIVQEDEKAGTSSHIPHFSLDLLNLSSSPQKIPITMDS